MKLKLFSLSIVFFLVSLFYLTPTHASSVKDVYVNGKEFEASLTEKGVKFIPLESIIKQVGDKSTFDYMSRTTTITKGKTTIEVTIGKNYVVVDGKQINVNVKNSYGNSAKSMLINNVTYVPYQFLEKMGYPVATGYINATQITYIGSLPKAGANPLLNLNLEGYSHEDSSGKGAKLYRSADPKSKVKGYIPYPQRFKVTASKNGFYQINYNGKTGWVDTRVENVVKTMKPPSLKDGSGPSKGQTIPEYIANKFGLSYYKTSKGVIQGGVFHAYFPIVDQNLELNDSTFTYYEDPSSRDNVQVTVSFEGWTDTHAFYNHHPEMTREILRMYFPNSYKAIFKGINIAATTNQKVSFVNKYVKYDSRYIKLIPGYNGALLRITKAGLKSAPAK